MRLLTTMELTRLLHAAKHGNVEEIRGIEKCRVNLSMFCETILEVAAENGQVNVIEYVTAKYNINLDKKAFYLSLVAARSGHLNVIKLFSRDNTDGFMISNCVFLAASCGHLNIVRYAISKFSLSKSDYGNSLSSAIIKNRFPIVKFLIEDGADVHSEQVILQLTNNIDTVKIILVNL